MEALEILGLRRLEGVALRFDVDHDLGLVVWSHKDIKDLFSGPELDGFDDGGRWQVDMHVGIGHVAADLRKLTAVEEAVFAGQEPRCGDEVLDGCNNWLTTFWRD